MALTVEGQKCPVCNGYLFDDDDLVFCPECGAPHHRDCYAAKGECGLKELHGTDKQYKRPEPPEKEPEAPKAEAKSRFSGGEVKIKTVCPNCKTVVDNGTDLCPNCQTPIPLIATPYLGGLPVDPLGGVPENARLEDGSSPKEVAIYTAVNTPRYVRKFFSLSKDNKASWNWAAFLFPNAWYFYRKIYFPGIMFFLLLLLSSVMTLSINFAVEGMSFATMTELATYFAENLESIEIVPLMLFLLGGVLNVATRIISGIFGDYFYRKNAIERIAAAKNDEESADSVELRMHRRGGINPLLGILGLMAFQWLPYLIFSLL